MALPPVGPDTYDSFQFEWNPVPAPFGSSPVLCSVAGSGYAVAKYEFLECDEPGLPDGLRIPEFGGDVSTEYPDVVTPLWTYPGVAAVSLTISVGLYLFPGSILWIPACQTHLYTYKPELDVQVRENSGDGPVAVNSDGEPLQMSIRDGIVVEAFPSGYMGGRRIGWDDPFPSYTYVAAGFFHNIYPILTINAAGHLGEIPTEDPDVPPPPSPPPTELPPMPGCLNIAPSEVNPGPNISGMVKLG